MGSTAAYSMPDEAWGKVYTVKREFISRDDANAHWRNMRTFWNFLDRDLFEGFVPGPEVEAGVPQVDPMPSMLPWGVKDFTDFREGYLATKPLLDRIYSRIVHPFSVSGGMHLQSEDPSKNLHLHLGYKAIPRRVVVSIGGVGDSIPAAENIAQRLHDRFNTSLRVEDRIVHFTRTN